MITKDPFRENPGWTPPRSPPETFYHSGNSAARVAYQRPNQKREVGGERQRNLLLAIRTAIIPDLHFKDFLG